MQVCTHFSLKLIKNFPKFLSLKGSIIFFFKKSCTCRKKAVNLHPFMKNRTQYIATTALVVSMIFWSISGIAIKQALTVLPPLTLIILRFTPSVLLMLLVGLIWRKSELFGLQRVAWRDLPLFIAAGFCQPFLYYLLEVFSFRALNSPTIAEALLSTSPLLAPLFAAVLLREKVTRNNMLGIVISTVGMLLLLLVGSQHFAIGSYWGILLAFAAVSAAIMDTIVIRKIPERYNPLTIIFYGQTVSLLFFYPLWMVQEGPSSIYNLQFTINNTQLMTALGCVAYLTVFASVIAFILFCYALRKVGVTQANAFNNIRPAFTAIWMLLFFGEQMPVSKWIGMIFIILGLFICQKK